jgi:hypothetical protein
MPGSGGVHRLRSRPLSRYDDHLLARRRQGDRPGRRIVGGDLRRRLVLGLAVAAHGAWVREQPAPSFQEPPLPVNVTGGPVVGVTIRESPDKVQLPAAALPSV